ncbi:MAG: hypothetical protein PF961_02800 [Planctomycetota bacterium]|jgi:hypothetical protein|nr:hypothetical protein [Planctomycetota bacterium]
MIRIFNLVLGLVLMTAMGAAEQAGDSAELPQVRWPGTGLGADFRAYKQPATAWKTGRVRANEYDHSYLTGAPIEVDVDLVNGGAEALEVGGTWRWVWLGERAADGKGGVQYVPGDAFRDDPLPVSTIAPEASLTVRVPSFAAPDRRGLLGLYLIAADGSQRWVTNVLVLWPTVAEPLPESMFFADARGWHQWARDLELKTMAKLGVKWTRAGVNMAQLMPKPGVFNYKKLDHEIESLRKNGMLAIFLGGHAPEWTQPYGRLSWPRNNPQKQDSTPSPLHYGDWADYWEAVVSRHKDVIRAVNVWNEPWEAGGISNWGGTGAHYRNLQRFAKLGVMRGDPTVLVGGNDSDLNIVDNLMCDPSWRSYTDIMTVHGASLPGALVHALEPDMPIWQTELWYTAQVDRSVQWQLFEAGRGVKKVNLLVLGNAYSAGYKAGGYYGPKKGNVVDVIPQPNAAGYNTMSHFLEGMDFVHEPSPTHLPYQFVFKRRQATTDAATHGAVAVVFGQNIEPDKSMWWQVKAGPDAKMRFVPTGAISGVYDRFGTPFPQLDDGSYMLPCDTRPVYVTAASVEALEGLHNQITVVSYEHPVQLGLHDPTALFAKGVQFGVQVTNAMSMPMPVEVEVRGPDGWRFSVVAQHAQPVAPGASVVVPVRIEELGEYASGVVPVTITASTPLGAIEWNEPMRSRVIPRFTPTIGGGIAEWHEAGIDGAIVTPSSTADDALLAAMPWESISSEEGNLGRWALAYDDRYLYLMAQLRSEQRGDLPWDQTRSDWYELHPGGYAYKRAPEFPFTGEQVQIALDVMRDDGEQLYPSDHPLHRRYPMRKTDYLFGCYETRQGGSQAWMYHRPGGPWRHRYPFSPMTGQDQMVPPGTLVSVTRDEETHLTTFEMALPLALMPELKAEPGVAISGIEVKLGTKAWSGLFSAASKGVCKQDQSVFQPYWRSGYSAEVPWRFGE